MTAEGNPGQLAGPHPPEGSLPAQDRRRVVVPPADRLVRQVEAIGVWVIARRDRERRLSRSGMSRNERMDVTRQVEVLRRTHDTIKGHCARALAAEVGPMCRPGPTAVLAHRHAWLREQVAWSLAQRGVTVVASTDNGAEALGAVVAEQPDLLLTGDCLLMMAGDVLLHDARLFADSTLRAAMVPDSQHATAMHGLADAVLAARHPTAVAEALIALPLDHEPRPDSTTRHRLDQDATS